MIWTRYRFGCLKRYDNIPNVFLFNRRWIELFCWIFDNRFLFEKLLCTSSPLLNICDIMSSLLSSLLIDETDNIGSSNTKTMIYHRCIL